MAAWTARDWERVVALYRRGFRRIDRRAMVQLELDRDQHVEFQRPLFEMSTSRIELAPLATRGNRLALSRFRFDGADGSTGPTVIEELFVSEVDDHGEVVALVIFDPDDLDAAYAELDERYAAGEGASSGTLLKMVARDLAARDWDGLAARLAPDIVVYDHRPIGWDTLRGPQAYVEILEALVDLAPDARIRADHVLVCGRRELTFSTLLGTREGGAFEDRRIVVAEGDDQGRIRRIDFYTLDQLEEARTRFAQRADPLRIPPNAAARVRDRYAEALAARDWSALRALVSDDFTFEDRTKRALLSGDVELWMATLRVIASDPNGRFAREIIGTVGDRIAVDHVTWTGGPDGSPAEVVSIRVIEVDADGRLRALINFDLDDRSAAFAAAYDRFAAGEAASIGGQTPISAFSRAYAARDWESVRGCLADDLVLHDRRLLGLGSLGRDEWVAALRMQADLAPDVFAETVRILACDHHGRVDVQRLTGTMPDGGGPFEKVYVCVMLTGGDRIQRVEFFDVGDTDQALARFAELCAAPPSGAR